jgi:hypothetical protein
MARPEYPTSIRLASADKRRLRKHADKFKHSLAGLIQMILMQWLETQEKKDAVVEQPCTEVGDNREIVGSSESP